MFIGALGVTTGVLLWSMISDSLKFFLEESFFGFFCVSFATFEAAYFLFCLGLLFRVSFFGLWFLDLGSDFFGEFGDNVAGLKGRNLEESDF